MTKLEVTGIGLAEQAIIRTILSDEKTANRTTAYMVKRLRNAFKMRHFLAEVREATQREKDRLINEEGWKEDTVRNISLTWEAMLEESWQQPEPDGEEIYGNTFTLDSVDAQWLLDKLEKKEHWRTDAEDKPLPIESAMMEAIANLTFALEEALKPDES